MDKLKNYEIFLQVIKLLVILENTSDYLSFEFLKENIKLKEEKLKEILKKLKDVNILSSSRGKNGGYFLKESIRDFKLLEIYNYIFNNNIENIELNRDILKILENFSFRYFLED